MAQHAHPPASEPAGIPPRTPQDRRWRFLGLQRSGNHAVIQWCLAPLGAEIVFSNSARPERTRAGTPWVTAEALAAARNVAFSLEDHALAYAGFGPVEVALNHRFGDARDRVDILVMRDPFNLFASRLEAGYVPVTMGGFSFVDFWVDYAREALGIAHRLHRARLVVANYNRWSNDVAYRQELARQLDIPFTDAERDTVAPFGGGSSFDGKAGSASALATDRRWLKFADNPAYLGLFRDRTVIELARRLFDLDPELDAFAEGLLSRCTPSARTARALKLVALNALAGPYRWLRYHRRSQ
jgi:hypothetical protein